VAELLAAEPEAIVQRLTVRLVETHYLNRETQLHAWRQQIALLRTVLHDLPRTWQVLFEYPLLRLGRRIDTIVLTEAAILVLEFKVGATAITTLDRQQTEDYALDLFDFHAEKPRASGGADSRRDTGKTSGESMAAAVAWRDPGVRRIGHHAGAASPGVRYTHPRTGTTARCPCLGKRSVSAGADHR
jgi:hypothetical protein